MAGLQSLAAFLILLIDRVSSVCLSCSLHVSLTIVLLLHLWHRQFVFLCVLGATDCAEPRKELNKNMRHPIEVCLL